jgi:hypothetical protein
VKAVWSAPVIGNRIFMDCRLITQFFANAVFIKYSTKKTLTVVSFMALVVIPQFPAFASKPCWLTNLNIDHKNIYGVSSKISASNMPALHFAKANALNNWLLSEGLKPVGVIENLAPLEQYTTQQHTIYFVDQYEENNRIYSLVSDRPDTDSISRSCEVNTCDIKQCSPLWLCENTSDNISIIAVSERTAMPNTQIKSVIQNAQNIAETINNAHVKGYVDILHSQTKQTAISNTQQRYSITQLTEHQPKVTIGEMCSHRGTLFSQVTLNKQVIGSEHNWVDQPLLGDILGVVGYAEGQTSTGRLSDLINVAVRRALFEMAKAKNINVKNNLKLVINEQGYYSLVRKSHQYTESVVSAYIADMKMKINDKLQPEIFIWLLENKDRS